MSTPATPPSEAAKPRPVGAWARLCAGDRAPRPLSCSLAQFLADEGASRGWKGLVWWPRAGAAILAPGVLRKELAPWAYRQAVPGEVQAIETGLGARLEPAWIEWVLVLDAEGSRPAGTLRWLAPAGSDARRADWAREARAVLQQLDAAQRWWQVQRESRAMESAAGLGLRAGGVLHDLRNRLTLLSLQLQRMQVDPRETDRWQAANHRLVAEMRAMCAGLLPGEHGCVALQRTELRPLLLRVARRGPSLVRRSPGVGRAGVRLRCRTDLTALVDPVLLTRVVENLLVNALEASGPDQVVSLQAEPSGDQVVIEVRDEGRGMDAATLRSAFRAGQGAQHGTGFGSVSLLAALEDLQGTLDVDSAPGVGTRSRVTLPQAPEGPTALLLDPDSRRRSTVTARLKRHGIEVQGMAHAAAAIRSMGEVTPTAIYAARGMQDPHWGDLCELAAAQSCPVWVLGSRGLQPARPEALGVSGGPALH